ncbi:hypothetical protein JBE04_39900 [Streptomyces sp. PRKS01-29]|nr:hypothetical protein [Streptomyces sabulosicollis]MBI0300460.1 hypothetical protein [Streptomyces sabulosicollis]
MMTTTRGKQPIPADADVLFVETLSTGTVHIAVRTAVHHRSGPSKTVASGGTALVALATTPTVTRCGKRTFPQFETQHEYTVRFADDQLCTACYRTLTTADQERAFGHEQPERSAP